MRAILRDFSWSPDGRSIAFLMEDPPSEEEEAAEKRLDDAQVVDEDSKTTHLWVVPVDPGADGEREPRQVTRGDFSLGSAIGGGFDWSPDGLRIVFSHQPTPRVNDWPLADISMADVETGEVWGIATSAAAEARPLFSPDGQSIAYTASDKPATWAFTSHVYVIPAEGGEPRRLAATFDEQPNPIGWSADSQVLYFMETHGTVSRLSALPIDGVRSASRGTPAHPIESPDSLLTAFRDINRASRDTSSKLAAWPR